MTKQIKKLAKEITEISTQPAGKTEKFWINELTMILQLPKVRKVWIERGSESYLYVQTACLWHTTGLLLGIYKISFPLERYLHWPGIEAIPQWKPSRYEGTNHFFIPDPHEYCFGRSTDLLGDSLRYRKLGTSVAVIIDFLETVQVSPDYFPIHVPYLEKRTPYLVRRPNFQWIKQ